MRPRPLARPALASPAAAALALAALLVPAHGAALAGFDPQQLMLLPADQSWEGVVKPYPLPTGELLGQGVPQAPVWPGEAVPEDEVHTVPEADAALDEAAPASLAPDRVAEAAWAAAARASAGPPSAPSPAVPAAPAAPALPAPPAAPAPPQARVEAGDVVREAKAAWDRLPVWAPYDALWYGAPDERPAEAEVAGVSAARAPEGVPAALAVDAVRGEGLAAGSGAALPAPLPPAPAGAPHVPASELSTASAAAAPEPLPAAAVLLAAAGLALLALLRPALALYHRIAPSRLLDQPTRRAVHDAIAAEPGVRIGTLQARLGLNYNTVLHHVRALARGGLVEARGPGQRRWFVAGRHAAPEQQAAVAASGRAARRVLAHLRATGSAELPALRAELGIPRSTASDAVARLAAAGLVRVERHGARVRVRAQ